MTTLFLAYCSLSECITNKMTPLFGVLILILLVGFALGVIAIVTDWWNRR
jgi:hypothetical protein